MGTDDFADFDQAVLEGVSKGFHVAWSNQSFEYWIYLHFAYSDSALHRDEWCEKLDLIFKENQLGEREYRKNYEDIYDILEKFGGVDAAIRHAKRRMAGYEKKKDKPSQYDPGTMVHILVEELREYLK